VRSALCQVLGGKLRVSETVDQAFNEPILALFRVRRAVIFDCLARRLIVGEVIHRFSGSPHLSPESPG
jgi:hypothetical protein